MARADWRHIPADEVEEVIRRHVGHYPPTLHDLEAVAERHHYQVRYWAYKQLPFAYTNQTKQIIEIPTAKPFVQLRILLHEVAELLLRLPVAAEFQHPISPFDEKHKVASLVEDGLQRAMQARKEATLEQIRHIEEEDRQLEIQIQKLLAKQQTKRKTAHTLLETIEE